MKCYQILSVFIIVSVITFPVQAQDKQKKSKSESSNLNPKGVESLNDTIEIGYEVAEKKTNLYIIAIGTSKYIDSNFNLGYASKDARDFAAFFKNESEMYANVYIKTLTDEQVIKDNIGPLGTFLEQAGRDDVVMLFISGHGTLDAQYDYYFATHDMDFNNPSKHGIKYETLKALLDGITALKKILIVDAALFGEVETVRHKETEQEEVVFKDAGVGIKPIKPKECLGMENITDHQKGTGAMVIFYAGGYAMESDKWDNGLFTFCILNALKNKKADMNKDGKVMISELHSYVCDQVRELSKGRQVPTAKMKNISMDFRVW